MKKRFLTVFDCILLIISPVFSLLSSCQTDNPVIETRGVLDGRISSGGYPVAVLMESIGTDKDEVFFKDKLIMWAKVTIDDGENEVIMTGGPDSNLAPPYRYYTFDMKGEPGKTYTITAEYKDIYVKAAAVMQEPTPIKTIEINKIDGKDSLCSLVLSFISPENGPAFYYVTLRNNINDRQMPAFISAVQTSETGGTEYRLPLMRPKIKIDSLSYEPDFPIGSEWEISLNRINKEEYEFWKSYDESIMTSSSPFFNKGSSLRGNVEGGYGIWSVCGSDTRLVTIQPHSN